jgi:hypothetical protein
MWLLGYGCVHRNVDHALRSKTYIVVSQQVSQFFFIITSEAISLTATILAFDYPGLALGSFFIFFFSLHVFIFFYLKDAFKWWLTVFLNLWFVYVVLALNLSVLVFTSLFYCREVPRGLSRPPYKKRLEKEKWDIQIYRRLTRRFDDTFMTI